jgi:site-specific DNA-methyltransferase (adenine-specific)
MGQRWDGFDSLESYQDWVADWAAGLIENALYPGAVALFFGGTRTFHHLGVGLERGGFEITDTLMWLHGQGFPKSHKIVEGYYTAIKPAWEPIYLCRAPRDRSFKKLMAEYGTGGLNVDGSRIPAPEPYTINTFDDGAKPFGDAEGEAFTSRKEARGRWPANVILGDDLEPEFVGPQRYFYCAKASKSEKNVGLDNFYWRRIDNGFERIEAGQYERLEDADRATGNIHPTVKPLDLLRYLATLMLPPILRELCGYC